MLENKPCGTGCLAKRDACEYACLLVMKDLLWNVLQDKICVSLGPHFESLLDADWSKVLVCAVFEAFQ